MNTDNDKSCAAPAESFCTLDAAALDARRSEWIAAFRPLLVGARRRTGGFELRLRASPEARALVARFIDVERRCCEPLRYAVSPDAPDGSFGVTIDGPGETAAFLGWLLDLAAPGDVRR